MTWQTINFTEDERDHDPTMPDLVYQFHLSLLCAEIIPPNARHKFWRAVITDADGNEIHIADTISPDQAQAAVYYELRRITAAWFAAIQEKLPEAN